MFHFQNLRGLGKAGDLMPTPLVAISSPPNLPLLLTSNMAAIALNQNKTPPCRLGYVKYNQLTILKYSQAQVQIFTQTPHRRGRTGAWACRVQLAPLHQKEVDGSYNNQVISKVFNINQEHLFLKAFKDGASLCYCAYVLRISRWYEKLLFFKNVRCLLLQRYFLRDLWEKKIMVRAVDIQKDNWG